MERRATLPAWTRDANTGHRATRSRAADDDDDGPRRLHEAEDLGGVQRVKGRAAYRLRRVAVDAATELGISAEGLQEHGGWTDSQTPNTIYRDQERRTARKEARAVRAKIRGETATEPPATATAEEDTE